MSPKGSNWGRFGFLRRQETARHESAFTSRVQGYDDNFDAFPLIPSGDYLVLSTKENKGYASYPDGGSKGGVEVPVQGVLCQGAAFVPTFTPHGYNI
jgi:hypothetical protein